MAMFLAVFSCSNEPELLEQHPNEWMTLNRMYPHSEMDYQAIQKAREQAFVQINSTIEARQNQPEWTLLGPENIGGRITDLAISPDNDQHIYAACSVGGLFKSTDQGSTWNNVTDGFDVELSVGNMAIAPSNGSRIYLGTGEANGSATSGAFFGNGVFRSDDAGESWTAIGLESSGHIGRIVVDPTDQDRLFVAATGALYGKNEERGLYRSLNGGDTWDQVLYINDSTAVIDVAMNPNNPDILFAATWERIRYPWIRDYGGTSSGVYRSLDGGDTWEKMINGLPESDSETGRIGLAIAESDPDVVYASFTTNSITNVFDGLYKSEDNGANWFEISLGQIDNVNSSFGWFFGNLRVHPEDPNDVFVLGQKLYRGNFAQLDYEQITQMHVDHHALEISRNNPDFMIAGNDGGVYYSNDGGQNWFHYKNLPITQFYNIEVDESNTEIVLGGTQDNNTILTQTGSADDWYPILGGDGFHVNVDPDEGNIVYAEYQFGNLFKSVEGGANMEYALFGVDQNDRTNWNTPVVLSPYDNDVVYYGSNRLYRSNQAEVWLLMSPDLTNGLHPSGASSYGTITAIAPSYNSMDVVYTGSDDGRVHVTMDGGNNWTPIDADLPERYVSQIAVHPDRDSTVLVVFSGFAYEDYTPHVFVSEDAGHSWTDISWNLPDIPLNDIVYWPGVDAWVVSSDMGVWVNYDYWLKNWEVLGTGLPASVISDLRIHEPSNTLYAGTFGRSIFSLDLTEVSPDTATNNLALVNEVAIHVYPNPVSNILNVELDSPFKRLTIFNQLGQKMEEYYPNSWGLNSQLDVSNLDTGWYIIDFEFDAGSVRKKILKQ